MLTGHDSIFKKRYTENDLENIILPQKSETLLNLSVLIFLQQFICKVYVITVES